MASRVLIFVLSCPAVAFWIQEQRPVVVAPPSRASLSIAAAVGVDDVLPSGECTCPDPENGGRYNGEIPPAFVARETAAGCCDPDAIARRGPGPVLSSLSDSLILSRPPPAAPGRS